MLGARYRNRENDSRKERTAGLWTTSVVGFAFISGLSFEYSPSDQISRSRLWKHSERTAPPPFHLRSPWGADMLSICSLLKRYHENLGKCCMNAIHGRTILVVRAADSQAVNRYSIRVCASRV